MLASKIDSSHVRGGNSMWRAMRDIILKRDNFRCRLCGSDNKKEFKRYGWGGNYATGLNIHHIDYNEDNSHPSNLITLCPKCHGKTSGAFAISWADKRLDPEALRWKNKLSLMLLGITYKF